MKTYLHLLLLLLFCSCSSEDKESKVAEKRMVKAEFHIEEHSGKFKHRNILKFVKDSVQDLNSQQAIYEIHTPIISDLHLQVFQDPKNIDTELNPGTRVLYSIQDAKGHQGILVAGMDDGWVDNIYYRSYDKNGKFLAEAVLYQKGGEGGYHTHSFGNFINDSTYLRHTIHCEPIDLETMDDYCDSTSVRIIIHTNGKIEVIK